MDHPLPWLRYVDADDLESSTVDFDGMDVRSASGEKLGDVDGFIVDASAGRPYYVVVDAGGWFRSKFFLLPIGHVSFDPAANRMTSEVSRDRVERYPGFDRNEFEKLSDAQLRRMHETIVGACCPTENLSATSRVDEWAHHQQPSWWEADFYRPDRADKAAQAIAGTWPASSETQSTRESERSRERVTAHADEESRNVTGRAKPGEVLGPDTGKTRVD